MQRRARGSLQRFAVVAVSAGMSAALVSGIGGPATEWSARAANYAVLQVAAIADSPSTIGIAEGHDFYLMPQAEIDRTVDAMQALGVQNVRVGIFWADIEPEEGVFNWANVDRMVEAANLRGMGVLGTILYTPEWAGATQPPEETEWASHPDPVKFGDFVSVVAEKYEGRISTYEIWNEPTGSLFWDPVSPKAYTGILKEGYQAIKAVDPSAVVIAGSVVAGPTYADGSALSPVDFLEGMYEFGAKGYFDAISYHPYQYTMSFSNGANQPDEFDYPIEQLVEIRNLMIAKGDGDLKVWITEYGQPTNTVSQNITLTEQQQAAYIEDLLRRWQTIDGAGPVFIYQTRDSATGNGDPDGNIGLYETDWDPKLAAAVLKALIKEFNPPASAANPLEVIFQQLAQTIGQVLAFVPNLIAQVVQAVVSFVGSIFGINPPSVRAGAAPSATNAMFSLEPHVSEGFVQADNARKMIVDAPQVNTGTFDGESPDQALGVPDPLPKVDQPEQLGGPNVQTADEVLDDVPLDAGSGLAEEDSGEDILEPTPGTAPIATKPDDLATVEDLAAEDGLEKATVDSEAAPGENPKDNDPNETATDAVD